MSDVTESLLKELSDVVPTKYALRNFFKKYLAGTLDESNFVFLSFRITSGKENVLIHFVQVDIGEGALMAAPARSSDCVMHAFRNACSLIHVVLQNTARCATSYIYVWICI